MAENAESAQVPVAGITAGMWRDLWLREVIVEALSQHGIECGIESIACLTDVYVERGRCEDAHAALLAIQAAIREAAVPGAVSSSVYEAAAGKARDLGMQDYFQGYGEQQGSFVGHGLGLEVDELPLLSPRDTTVIKENMTFTTEIFILHPDFGEVKLEDTLRVTDKGTEFLTELEREVTEV